MREVTSKMMSASGHMLASEPGRATFSTNRRAMRCVSLGLAVAVAAATPAAAQSVASPDGHIAMAFTDIAGTPKLTLTVAGRTIIAPSTLGLAIARGGAADTRLVAIGSDMRDGKDSYAIPFGKTSHVDELYREITIHYAAAGTPALDVIARAYDTGVALRYRVPVQRGMPQLRITGEMTQFAFPNDYACYGLNLGSFTTGHEGEFLPISAAAIRATDLFELPLTCRTSADGPAIALAEADVDNWPAAYLSGSTTGSPAVRITLSPRSDERGLAVKRDLATPVLSPWRVVMIAASPGKLIENTLLTSLNPPPAGNYSWVKAGKTAWDWWSGPVLAGVPDAGSNDATERAFIDFAAANGFRYHMIDEGWYVHSGSGPKLLPGADPTKPVDAIHLPELVRYAGGKGVGLIVWIHWKLLDRDMEPILDQVERWGLKGIKVDFMNGDDQTVIDFYHRLAAATARHHLLLDLHGATHPWGMTRTYPNFITQEGVFGAENNKWTALVTARHNVNLVYTRMLTGPMDYTPGGFRNRTPATFAISFKAPYTQTTRGAALAMYVLYESPLQSVADSPDAYTNADGMDFLRAVPTTWDETRFLDGDPGSHVAIARRRGRIWYVGAMTAGPARVVHLPLGFLGTGRYSMRTWEDGAAPTRLRTATRAVVARDAVDLSLAASGGAVAIIEPAR